MHRFILPFLLVTLCLGLEFFSSPAKSATEEIFQIKHRGLEFKIRLSSRYFKNTRGLKQSISRDLRVSGNNAAKFNQFYSQCQKHMRKKINNDIRLLIDTYFSKKTCTCKKIRKQSKKANSRRKISGSRFCI